MIHELKTHPPYFQAVYEGKKTHEVRVNDRNYRVGDILRLREYFPKEITGDEGVYTGREVHVAVTYVTPGGVWSLPDNLCILSITRWATDEEIWAWLDSTTDLDRFAPGTHVPLRGHEDHVVGRASFAHTPEKIVVTVRCSCGATFDHNKRPEGQSGHIAGCVSPSGLTNAHGKWVDRLGGMLVCSFCKSPLAKLNKKGTR